MAKQAGCLLQTAGSRPPCTALVVATADDTQLSPRLPACVAAAANDEGNKLTIEDLRDMINPQD